MLEINLTRQKNKFKITIYCNYEIRHKIEKHKAEK